MHVQYYYGICTEEVRNSIRNCLLHVKVYVTTCKIYVKTRKNAWNPRLLHALDVLFSALSRVYLRAISWCLLFKIPCTRAVISYKESFKLNSLILLWFNSIKLQQRVWLFIKNMKVMVQ